MFDKPILFYSNYCQHSQNFLKQLSVIPELFDEVLKVNIDVDAKTRKRHPLFYDIPKRIGKQINEVPTLIVNNYFLVGSDTSKWLYSILESQESLQQQAPQQIQEPDLEAFNPNEMGSFSDGYATLNESDNMTSQKRQSYYFLNDRHQPITTVAEDSFNNNSDAKLKEREQFDNITRQQGQQKQGGIMSHSAPKLSEKQKNAEAMYEKLLLERQKL